MITVHFPKYLRSLTNNIESHIFETDDFQLLNEGLKTLFPKLGLYLVGITSKQVNNICYFIDKDTKTLIKPSLTGKLKQTNLLLIITIYGEGGNNGGLFSVLAGVALVAGGFILGPSVSAIGVSGFLTGSQIASLGLSLVITGVLSLLNASNATAPDQPMRAHNDMFGPLQNTTSTDTAIPLIFGLHRVAGQLIGGQVSTFTFDGIDPIYVYNYVY